MRDWRWFLWEKRYPDPMEDREKLLRVCAPHFCAGAIWRKIDGKWRCVEAAPILSWMRGRDPLWVRDYMKAKGWTYSWHDHGKFD